MDEFETTQRAAGVARGSLPALMTTTLGREREIAELVALLRAEEVRLVTLTGPGGVGKTRLSLEVGQALAGDFADGVFFISLASLREQGQVLLTLAQTVGLAEGGGHDLERLLYEYLASKNCLLLLDNFEHILPVAYLVAELLAHAPALKMLVTSREMLHLYGEREVVVSPLALPELDGLEVVSENAAMALFVERARAINATFELQGENRRAVAEICAQLDGLPLAIELAAARSKLLPPQAILARLHHRLSLLTNGPRDLPARQQTLRKTLDWSYDLLNAAERRFFRSLGVFTGTWTLEAAAAVTGEEALDLLTSLVDKSLVRPTESPGGEPRFLLLETIREYALECLQQHGEDVDTRLRHAAVYRDLAEAIEPRLQGAAQLEGLQDLDREAANIWAALRWSIDAREIVMALRIASALREYLPLRSSMNGERQWLEEVLALEGEHLSGVLADAEIGQVSLLRARVLYGAGVMARMRSDFTLARTRLREGQEIAQQVGDYSLLALILGVLAQVECYPGNYVAARELVEEGLRAAEHARDTWARGVLQGISGTIASKQGDFATAQTRYTSSLVLLSEVGDRHRQAETLVYQGSMVYQRGKLRTAHYLYRKGLQLFREIGNRRGQLICLTGMGEALLMQGSYAESRASFEESLALAGLLGERAEQAAALTGLGYIELCLDERLRAGQYFKEALRLARELKHTQCLATVLAGLGDRECVQHNWEGALAYYRQGFELVSATGDKLILIRLLSALGDTARRQGKYTLACSQLKQSLSLAWEAGNHIALATGLEALAWLCVEVNQPEHGVLLLSAAHNLRETLQTPLAPVCQPPYERDLAALKTAIGQAAFNECWAQGRALLLKQVMTTGVSRVHVAETPAQIQTSPSPSPYHLTARELDVLRLLAEGHPDARIAQALVLSPRTVNTHLRSIYAKLGVSSRSRATRLALEQKLI